MRSQIAETCRTRHGRGLFRQIEPLSEEGKGLARALAVELDRLTTVVADDRNRPLHACSRIA
jgi:hypothetical protein